MTRRCYLLPILLLAATLSILCSLCVGSFFIPLTELGSQTSSDLHAILMTIRLPRTLCAFVTGGLLGLAGGLMQILLRNPLADPYVLGISGGAATTTLLLMIGGISGLSLTAGTWLGSLITVLFLFFLNQSVWQPQRLLLTGVALASGFGAAISFLLLVAPDRTVRGLLFWLMGDLSYAEMPGLAGSLLIIGLILSLLLARPLTILQRGELAAQTLGVPTQKLQILLYLLSSALTAAAVTLAGCVGFVGLIVPHLLRLLGAHDLRLLLPGTVLLGGTLLTLADTLSRTLWQPQQLPVGIMMSLIGIPVFLILLQRDRHDTVL